jgi:hypothetical protein
MGNMLRLRCLLLFLAAGVATSTAADTVPGGAGGGSGRKLLQGPTTTRIQYSSDAARMAAIWVNPNDFEILGGAQAPKFTGSAVAAGVIQWARTDTHSMAQPLMYAESAVITTGDARRAISKAKYTGESAPTYPDITNKNIKASDGCS